MGVDIVRRFDRLRDLTLRAPFLAAVRARVLWRVKARLSRIRRHIPKVEKSRKAKSWRHGFGTETGRT